MSFLRSNRRLICAAALACLLVGCGFFTGAQERADRAEALLAKGAYHEAMIELKNARSDAAQDSRVQLLIARTAILLGNLDAAGSALQSASAAGADAAEVAWWRGQLLLRQGKQVELVKALDEKSLPVAASRLPALRALALGGAQRCDEAIVLARAALRDSGDSDSALRVMIAECYARSGNTPRALAELETAVKLAPHDASAGMALGRMQNLLGNRGEAEKSWQDAVHDAPGQLSVPQQALLLSALADRQIARGDLPALRDTHAKLLAIAPQGALTELVAARLEFMDGKVSEAVSTLRRVASTDPGLPAVRLFLAAAYLEQQNFEQARNELSELERNTPQFHNVKLVRELIDVLAAAKTGSAEYFMRLAAAYVALEQDDLARGALVRAHELAPESQVAQLSLARLELQAGNTEAALDITTALAAKYPDNGALLATHASALIAADRVSDAAKLFDRLLEQQPSAAFAIAAYRARLIAKLDAPLVPLQRWLDKNPADAQTRSIYADALRAAGENQRAISEFETLAVRAPSSPTLLNNLAWLYYLENDKRAEATARRAWELAPKSPAVADTFGWILVESGAVKEGLKVLAPADAVSGIAQPDIRLHYIVALSRQGESAQARELLAQLTAENPKFQDPAAAERLLASMPGAGTT